MRNGKITPEKIEQICKYIKIGVPKKDSAQACGICEATYYNWIKRGEKAKSGIYLKFLESTKKAESESIARDVAIIEKAAQDGRWQASAWRLERRHPDNWGRKEVLRQDIKTNEPLQIQFVDVRTPEDVQKLKELKKDE